MSSNLKVEEPGIVEPRQGKGLTALSAYLLMSIATIFWSGNIVATKIALKDFPPQILIPLRMTIAAALFLLISAPSLRTLFRKARNDWKTFAGLAATGIVLNQLFFMLGLWYSSVTHAALTFAMVPIFVLIISRWMHMEAITIPKILGVLVAFGGVVVLTFAEEPLDTNYGVGNLILLTGAVCFSIYTILAKRAAGQYDSLTLNVVSYAMGSLLVAPVMILTLPGFEWTSVSTSGWLAGVYVLIFGGMVPYVILYRVFDHFTASRVASFGYFQPLLASGFAIWLLQESITPEVVLAGVLILGGVYLAKDE